MTARAVRFAATFAALYAAHHVGDYWVQGNEVAARKGDAGGPGRRACAHHVATYTATCAATVMAVDRAVGLPTRWPVTLLAQGVNAATHYLADRRERGPMMWLARRLGKAGYIERGGAAHLDQAWHVASLAVTALIVAVGSEPGAAPHS